MISITATGSFQNIEAFLKRVAKVDIASILDVNGQLGVSALSSATPFQTGLTAHSWGYEVSSSGGIYSITWTNSDIENGFPVAIMLQYGHGTGTGGYVQGIDYINPALRPIFDKIADDVWKAVTSA